MISLKTHINYLILILPILILFSCSSLEFNEDIQKKLPEIGTVGVYKSYILGNDYQPKTILNIAEPIRLNVETIKISERKFFQSKDSIKKGVLDSTLLSLEILDKISMVKQINQNEQLLKYLKKGNEFRLVTQTTIHFPIDIISKFTTADEVYLFQEKQNTLSIQLRNENKIMETIDFNDGIIVDFTVSDFCWGQNDRRDIEIFDLIPIDESCGEDLYRSAKKVKEKNEFKF